MILRHGADSRQKTVVIVGVQRGGTSMVAGVVRELGVNLGYNLGNNHEDPEFLPKDLSAIRAVVARRNSQFDVWGWKMPHSYEYLARLAPALRNPFVIIVFRNLLATAESLVRRSGLQFERAFDISLSRTAQIASLVQTLACPLMLVDYDKATAKPEQFVQEISSFLHLPHDEGARARAIEMINPEIGYRRLSAERWRHAVNKADLFNGTVLNAVDVRRQDFNITRVEGRLRKTHNNAFIQFTGLDGSRFWLAMNRDSEPDYVMIAVDVGRGYSHNMTEKVSLFCGKNYVSVEAVSIHGIRIYPQFNGIWSNTKLFQIFA